MLKKEKGIIYFENSKGSTVGFDLNQLCWLGVKGTPVKNPPSGAKRAFERYYFDNDDSNMFLYRLCRAVYNGYKVKEYLEANQEVFKLIDRFTSMGLRLPNFLNMRNNIAEVLNSHFKEFVELVKSDNDNPIDTLVHKYQVINFFKKGKVNLNNYDSEFLHFVYKYFNNIRDIKYLPQVVWYIQQSNLYELYILEKQCAQTRFSCNYTSEVKNMIHAICRYAYELELPKLPKNELTRTYSQLMHTYHIKHQEIQNTKLREHQLNKELEFAFGNYVVIVPTTADEFYNEAEQQNNCVYRWYLPRVIKGETNVVFIRHKDNTKKSVVTCEICNGSIRQYLLKNNNYVGESQHPELYAFREIYQKYLNGNYQ